MQHHSGPGLAGRTKRSASRALWSGRTGSWLQMDRLSLGKTSVGVQDCREISDRFRGIHRTYANLIKEKRRMSPCNWLDSQTLRAGLHYSGEVHQSWKKGVSQLWLVENATLDRWVFTLGEGNNGGELFSWMIKWHGPLRGGTSLELGFSGGRVSCPASRG